MNKLIALTLLLNTHTVFACNGVLPPNDLYLPINDKNEGLSELQYNEVIDKVERIYNPVARYYGAILKIDRKWDSGTVNAGTFRDEQKKHWHVNLYGGLARHRFMTQDAYALVICHELGHHIGGAPKKIIGGEKIWSSTEGQADYWATLKCLKRIFSSEENTTAIQGIDVPAIVKHECTNSFDKKNEVSLCIRLAMASKDLSKISAAARRTDPPLFETPDASIVTQIYDKHPVPQCRLDSFFQGALCPKSVRETVSQQDEMKGTCHPQNGHLTGMRPLCWYVP